MGPKPRNIYERFEEKVERVPMSGCWIWTAQLEPKNGYGRFQVNGKTMGIAHRISYQIYKGEIPENLVVMHVCDTPACVNPDHLKLGTITDNNRDCLQKNRRPKKYRKN